MCKTTYSPVGRNGRIPDHANMLLQCQMVAKGFGRHSNKKKYTCTFENVAESALKACCLVEDAQGRSCCEPLRGWFWSTFYFVSWFFMTEYASLLQYLSKNVQVVIQVVNNKKVMAKTPREANLYGNWCVRKAAILATFRTTNFVFFAPG